MQFSGLEVQLIYLQLHFSIAIHCYHTQVHIGGIHMRDTVTKVYENVAHNLPHN